MFSWQQKNQETHLLRYNSIEVNERCCHPELQGSVVCITTDKRDTHM